MILHALSADVASACLCAVGGFAGVEGARTINVRAMPVRVLAASRPNRSRVPPCSGQSRPSPSGGREDAASLDRPCARRLCDLAVGTEECSRRGSNQRMDPTEQENAINRDRTSLLCPDVSPCSAWFLTAVHSAGRTKEWPQEETKKTGGVSQHSYTAVSCVQNGGCSLNRSSCQGS